MTIIYAALSTRYIAAIIPYDISDDWTTTVFPKLGKVVSESEKA